MEIELEIIGGPLDKESAHWSEPMRHIYEQDGKKHLYVKVFHKWFWKGIVDESESRA